MEGKKEEEQVMSEVHLGCPPGFSGSYVSHFTFSLPSTDMPDERSDDQLKMEMSSSQEIILDEDGDLLLTRRKNKNWRYLNYGFTIRHNITSSLGNVGLQVWRAALVLTEFIWHKSLTSSDFNDIIALELGAGTGLVGIALARVARTVFITDRGMEVLDNCGANVQLNSGLLKFHEPSIHIRELDWKEGWPPNLQTCDFSSQQSLYNNIHRPSKLAVGADFSCFKHKIEPKWEDPVCANGGKWTISCSRGKVDTWWLYTLLAMLGEQFDHGEEICGAVVNVRAKQEKISIWTKNGLDEAAQVSIGKQWKAILDYNDTIGFILHDDAKKHDRFAKSRYQI
ncbi:eukaryotic translation initiation factor 4E-1 isoform X1 [Elaeis guineensis]|uniref:mRNA cap-binding protein n=1 Tax=Elaeis guineensis var. tenera TaxID=51953 RepID=A0A8N4IAX9_ELAGV|nr:eukaryotic translation initiation factor 4E-1 isoform X1 [Elaeis guineensis]